MGEMTCYVDPATEQQLIAALTQSLGSMELAVRVTKAGISEIANTHTYAAEKVAGTLKIVEQEVKAAQAAGRLTPAKQATIASDTQVYLTDMLGITHDTGAALIEIMLRR
jgi:hypothetical protein